MEQMQCLNVWRLSAFFQWTVTTDSVAPQGLKPNSRLVLCGPTKSRALIQSMRVVTPKKSRAFSQICFYS
jgi:hypothetical protein